MIWKIDLVDDYIFYRNKIMYFWIDPGIVLA